MASTGIGLKIFCNVTKSAAFKYYTQCYKKGLELNIEGNNDCLKTVISNTTNVESRGDLIAQSKLGNTKSKYHHVHLSKPIPGCFVSDILQIRGNDVAAIKTKNIENKMRYLVLLQKDNFYRFCSSISNVKDLVKGSNYFLKRKLQYIKQKYNKKSSTLKRIIVKPACKRYAAKQMYRRRLYIQKVLFFFNMNKKSHTNINLNCIQQMSTCTGASTMLIKYRAKPSLKTSDILTPINLSYSGQRRIHYQSIYEYVSGEKNFSKEPNKNVNRTIDENSLKKQNYDNYSATLYGRTSVEENKTDISNAVDEAIKNKTLFCPPLFVTNEQNVDYKQLNNTRDSRNDDSSSKTNNLEDNDSVDKHPHHLKSLNKSYSKPESFLNSLRHDITKKHWKRIATKHSKLKERLFDDKALKNISDAKCNDILDDNINKHKESKHKTGWSKTLMLIKKINKRFKLVKCADAEKGKRKNKKEKSVLQSNKNDNDQEMDNLPFHKPEFADNVWNATQNENFLPNFKHKTFTHNKNKEVSDLYLEGGFDINGKRLYGNINRTNCKIPNTFNDLKCQSEMREEMNSQQTNSNELNFNEYLTFKNYDNVCNEDIKRESYDKSINSLTNKDDFVNNWMNVDEYDKRSNTNSSDDFEDSGSVKNAVVTQHDWHTGNKDKQFEEKNEHINDRMFDVTDMPIRNYKSNKNDKTKSTDYAVGQNIGSSMIINQTFEDKDENYNSANKDATLKEDENRPLTIKAQIKNLSNNKYRAIKRDELIDNNATLNSQSNKVYPGPVELLRKFVCDNTGLTNSVPYPEKFSNKKIENENELDKHENELADASMYIKNKIAATNTNDLSKQNSLADEKKNSMKLYSLYLLDKHALEKLNVKEVLVHHLKDEYQEKLLKSKNTYSTSSVINDIDNESKKYTDKVTPRVLPEMPGKSNYQFYKGENNDSNLVLTEEYTKDIPQRTKIYNNENSRNNWTTAYSTPEVFDLNKFQLYKTSEKEDVRSSKINFVKSLNAFKNKAKYRKVKKSINSNKKKEYVQGYKPLSSSLKVPLSSQALTYARLRLNNRQNKSMYEQTGMDIDNFFPEDMPQINSKSIRQKKSISENSTQNRLKLAQNRSTQIGSKVILPKVFRSNLTADRHMRNSKKRGSLSKRRTDYDLKHFAYDPEQKDLSDIRLGKYKQRYGFDVNYLESDDCRRNLSGNKQENLARYFESDKYVPGKDPFYFTQIKRKQPKNHYKASDSKVQLMDYIRQRLDSQEHLKEVGWMFEPSYELNKKKLYDQNMNIEQDIKDFQRRNTNYIIGFNNHLSGSRKDPQLNTRDQFLRDNTANF